MSIDRGLLHVRLIQSAVAVLAASVLTAPAAAQSVTYIENQKLMEAFSKPGNLVSASDYRVQTSRRVKPGGAEVHEKETDIFYVVDGAATFVTGGTVVEPKTSRPNQIAGAGINGGESRRISKGDVIVIPAGVPHWFKEVDGSINYLVVKVVKP
jgi:mannose-6-phosphate isomerase-like protein (cupin superfamily)